ncbi:MAG: S-adenosylmethionine:tRNA ribosyltransferase-isomerase [Candidatus Magasanikbacteria bacterium GW2011_GWC2_34_16]|uniref:S-adenosylmethionine:tRNA ribosyltransferase-isomerase n=2 Tax=Candidatus Magasanikiibacteriota TaxID=1752731 RepID=A0A0G0HBX7_9BACT|nr:MAG: S-adenosylmethionine:tRNA ribosyltransferase-isomerase [Candidatus Magasanikbacteria bacterium GW2011_GWC2_34_16]KKQ40708.1 MAG: S-adenosylmethionine:tRNA ribosyltransferase-isomerase [Candidatus Magasanikbacteria bacterium GW2011_GWA2_37_8]
MLTSDFNYNLPKELIAQTPAEKRDESRLLVINRETKEINHRQFFNIIEYLRPGDLLVWNNSKVFKARLKGVLVLDEEVFDLKGKDLTDRILNEPSVEIFLVRPMENFGVWKVLAKPGKKLRLGMKVVFAEDFFAEVITKEEDGTVLVQFQDDDITVRTKANKYGEVPTPPYIKEQGARNKEQLVERYQTVYAKEEGSVAAPTAGFHFTEELIEKLKNKGIEFAEVTLHVGLGTFLPVKVEKVEEHKMHAEWVELTDKNAQLINAAKAEGRRVVVVGTTAVRTLEGIFAKRESLEAFSGDINIFITPGFKFKVVDALITNFHLPESTLIMLVSAFVGDREFTLDCYKKAVEANYRFYSFGDAMFVF